MTQQELIDLEMERRSLLETVREMSKNDGRMETKLDEFLSGLEKRAQEIQETIDREITNR
jgi:hypothetical protein